MRNGAVFRQLVRNCAPLQILGTVNAYCALLAERAGAKAIYLSGSGVATASHGLPDLGITNLFDVVEDSRRITSVSKLPLLVDIDTGFGDVLGIARTIQALERAQVAAVHIEDQVSNAKRCGHRPGKNIVSTEEMCKRIRAAVDSRSDALAAEGIDGSLKRCEAYINAGADMLFIGKIFDFVLNVV
jgi:methylisocitrate lyase